MRRYYDVRDEEVYTEPLSGLMVYVEAANASGVVPALKVTPEWEDEGKWAPICECREILRTGDGFYILLPARHKKRLRFSATGLDVYFRVLVNDGPWKQHPAYFAERQEEKI